MTNSDDADPNSREGLWRAFVTFLANPTERERTVTLRPSEPGPWQAWDPVRVRRLALDSRADGVRVTLPAFGSLFVMPGVAPVEQAAAAAVDLAGDWSTTVSGEHLASTPDPELWTDHGVAGFSGTAVYRHTFTLAEHPADRQATLEFAEVRDIARVIVNGHDCGVVWTAPFACDVSGAVLRGRNDLEVHVANPWRNRLIAEAAGPSGQIFAPMTQVFEPTAAPLPAGLAGSVRLSLRN